MRDYRFLRDSGVSFALDAKDGRARLAVAFCNEQDRFSRKAGKTILDTLLDGTVETLEAFHLSRNVLSFRYSGELEARDFFKDLLEDIEDPLNERKLYRTMYHLVQCGANRPAVAEQDPHHLKMYAKVAAVLEDTADLEGVTELQLFNSVTAEEFRHVPMFFSWFGTADAVFRCVADFVADRREIYREARKEEATAATTASN